MEIWGHCPTCDRWFYCPSEDGAGKDDWRCPVCGGEPAVTEDRADA
jgi:hypothetical protein